jgi:hypothetical protein
MYVVLRRTADIFKLPGLYWLNGPQVQATTPAIRLRTSAWCEVNNHALPHARYASTGNTSPWQRDGLL